MTPDLLVRIHYRVQRRKYIDMLALYIVYVIKCRCGRSTSPRSSLSLVKRKVNKGSGIGPDAWSVRRRPIANSGLFSVPSI